MRKHDLLLLIPVLLVGLSGAVAAQTYTVQGSTTFTHRVLEPYQTAIEASSGHQLTVVPNKSSLGLLALFEKRADFAMISGPLEIQVDQLKLQRPELPYGRLRDFAIATTRMAFAVNPITPFAILPKSKCAPSY